MCRLYGFRANEETKVECSLVHAQNAMLLQSRADLQGRAHPHGWGIAFYHNAHPSVERRATAAYADLHFSDTAERIYTRTVVAHVRYATVGQPALVNSHPFTHGAWTFAHNGTITAFDQLKSQMEIAPQFQSSVQGSTDSEHTFFWLLTRMHEHGIDSSTPCQAPGDVARLVAESIAWLARRCEEAGAPRPATLNFVLTDGKTLVASRWNTTLSYVVREGIHDCEICGIPHVHHQTGVDYRAVVVASEPVTHEQWEELPDQSLLIVDADVRTETVPIGRLLEQGERINP